MSLRVYEGKHVRLTDIDHEVFEGYASEYVFPEDNNPNEEAIILDYPIRLSDNHKMENLIEFRASEIQSIGGSD